MKNLKGLSDYASSNNGAFYATAGQGTVTHLAAEMFSARTSTKLIPVHYKGGGDLLRDVLSGELKVTFSTIPPVREFIMNGQLTGIATTGSGRDFSLPDMPTFSGSGVSDYEVLLWLGLLAPKETPREILEILAKATAEALRGKDVEASLQNQGFQPRFRSPDQFDSFVRADIQKWKNLVEQIKLPLVH